MEEPCLHVKRRLQALVVHLELVVGVLVLGIGVAVASIS